MTDPISFLRWRPLPVGSPATALSLTADDGTWIKLPDFKGHLHVVLLFFRTADSPEVRTWLGRMEKARPRLEALDAALFAVSTARTDRLRALRKELGVEYFFLYDPFAMASRGYRASGRVIPACRDQVVVVGKDGVVRLDERGLVEPERILAAVAELEGKPVPPAEGVAVAGAVTPTSVHPVGDIDSSQAIAMLSAEGSPYVLCDVRTKAEWERGHSPLAKLRIPVDEIPHRYAELGQSDWVIFVCQGGGRSSAAAEFMSSIGSREIYSVLGGMSEWTGEVVAGP
jgi:rhodanese-related sulfurtransferase/peroxiredoxin